MKISSNLGHLQSTKIDKMLSKKILFANTASKINDKTGIAKPSNPLFFKSSELNANFKADIRYRNNLGYSAFEDISMRNMLLVFAENNEIKKAINAIANDMIVTELKSNKYPIFPIINKTLVSEDKQNVVDAILNYLNEVFWPELYQMYQLKGSGLKKLLLEFFTTGKLAWEIVYDNLKRPKNIVNMVPIDPAELYKIKKDGQILYVQRPVDGGAQRVLHENQIVLIEYNEYDYGYLSYVHSLQRPFNIMRSMMNVKINWFAVKSQVRMWINLNFGDMSRNKAEQLLIEAEQEYQNDFKFNDMDGTILLNDEPMVSAYNEYFTAEVAGSGSPNIEEVNSTGPDLTEVDSLQFFEKYFWKQTNIPYDRIDPSSQETWSFLDSSSVKKTEMLFSKFQLDNKIIINEMFLKPIIIQLTLKEVEIGIDISLLDSIQMEWVSFNEYEKMAELEVLDRKVQLANSLSDFGKLMTPDDVEINTIPKSWIIDNYFDYTPEQKEAMKIAFKAQQEMLKEYSQTLEHEEEIEEEEIVDDESQDIIEDESDDLGGILDSDNENF